VTQAGRLPPDIEDSVAAACRGDAVKLDAVVKSVRPLVYAIAIRVLWNREDAEDATQEALLRIVTGLAGFRGRSAFATWVYRVAANTVMSFRQSRMEGAGWTFERFGDDLASGLEDLPADQSASPEDTVLVEEIRIGCTLGMLQCLDRPGRLAYVLGEIMEIEAPEAAKILGISESAFRKRHSRARERIEGFTRRWCGIVSEKADCRCPKRLPAALRQGRVVPGETAFIPDAAKPRRHDAVVKAIQALDESRRVVALHRLTDRFRMDDSRLRAIDAMLEDAARSSRARPA
jgi:RNA polymerase sigma factor (sigma-70 family)